MTSPEKKSSGHITQTIPQKLTETFTKLITYRIHNSCRVKLNASPTGTSSLKNLIHICHSQLWLRDIFHLQFQCNKSIHTVYKIYSVISF